MRRESCLFISASHIAFRIPGLTLVKLSEGIHQVHREFRLLPRYHRGPARLQAVQSRCDNVRNDVSVQRLVESCDGLYVDAAKLLVSEVLRITHHSHLPELGHVVFRIGIFSSWRLPICVVGPCQLTDTDVQQRSQEFASFFRYR